MRVYNDESPTYSPSSEVTKLGKIFGTLIGVMAHPTSKAEMFLFEDETIDLNTTDDIRYCRYITDTTAVAGMSPVIQIDLSTGKVHFLSKMGLNTDTLMFERNGLNIEYIRTLPNF